MRNHLLVYALIILAFGLAIHSVLDLGKGLRPGALPVANHAPTSIWSNLRANAERPMSHLLIQLVLVVLVARAFGGLATRMGQPAVVGEMLAGILLGPSLLGIAWPTGFQVIFPKASLEMLRLLSQIGVCLFLFGQGMELEARHLRERASTAVMVSHISIVFPFFLGTLGALALYRDLAPSSISFPAFALFMGIAMSVTAFPVLARIVQERGLAGTVLGSTALTCAAVDDVTAWCVLALIVAAVSAGSMSSAVVCILFLVVFVSVMLFAVRPLADRWLAAVPAAEDGRPAFGLIAIVMSFVFASALATQLAGIHALFGSFLAGIVMPRRGVISRYLRVRIENFASAFLLPLFFAYTGLRTQVGLLNDLSGWLICLGLIGLATLGKLGGSFFAARMTGMDWKDSYRLGVLMNTRGLMELIALNIGYDLGILTARSFTMLVLMALVTTFLTGPLLNLVPAREADPALAPEPV